MSRWLVVGANQVCAVLCFLAAQQLCVERAEAFLLVWMLHAAAPSVSPPPEQAEESVKLLPQVLICDCTCLFHGNYSILMLAWHRLSFHLVKEQLPGTDASYQGPLLAQDTNPAGQLLACSSSSISKVLMTTSGLPSCLRTSSCATQSPLKVGRQPVLEACCLTCCTTHAALPQM